MKETQPIGAFKIRKDLSSNYKPNIKQDSWNHQMFYREVDDKQILTDLRNSNEEHQKRLARGEWDAITQDRIKANVIDPHFQAENHNSRYARLASQNKMLNELTDKKLKVLDPRSGLDEEERATKLSALDHQIQDLKREMY